MRTLVRRCGTAALATVTAAVATVLAATPAHADVTISQVALSATSTVINGDSSCGNRSKITVRVYDPVDADEVWGVKTDVALASTGDTADLLFLPLTSRSGNYAYYTDWINLCGWDTPGRYRVQTTVDWWDDSLVTARQQVSTTYLDVKRPTSLTYNASPEPVKRGRSLTHTGRLMFDPYAWGAMYGAKGVTIKFYFRKNGTSTYAYKGATVTGSGGYYSKKIVASYSGTWKAVYAGASTRQAQTKYDAVSVR